MNHIKLFAIMCMLMFSSGEQVQGDLVQEDSAMAKKTGKTWGFAFRFGGFSSSDDTPWMTYPARAEVGFELTQYFSARSGLGFALDAAAFSGEDLAIVPLTVTYKFFPMGNGSDGKRSPVQPWVGGGAGLYIHGPNYRAAAEFSPGGHVAGGAIFPMGSIFELNGELRYSLTDDFRLLSYLMGFGVRF